MSRRQLAYLCLMLFLGFIMNVAGTVGYVRHVEHERVKADQAIVVAKAEQAERTRQLVCQLANGYLRAFSESPPADGSAGVGVRSTWQQLAVQFLCPPVS